MKLWEKGIPVDKKIEAFTVGKDREMDLYLAPFDILGTMAHITMLESVGLLPKEDLKPLLAELKLLYNEAIAGNFVIEEGVEDVHSQVELMLTQRVGDLGKKVHSGRSRNDPRRAPRSGRRGSRTARTRRRRSGATPLRRPPPCGLPCSS